LAASPILLLSIVVSSVVCFRLCAVFPFIWIEPIYMFVCICCICR